MDTELNVALLASRIKTKRGSEGLRNTASEIGISAATLSRIEQEKVPDVDTFIKLCKWLGAPADTFTRNKLKKGKKLDQQNIIAHLRAEKSLDPEMVEIIASMIMKAYSRTI